MEKNARRYSVHGTGVMSPVAKVAFVFGVSFVIMVVVMLLLDIHQQRLMKD